MLDVAVADDGSGVPVAVLDHLFEPFARLDVARTEGDRRGYGLGLSIARSLARQMGGDVVHEPQARGALFRLTLRLDPAPAAVALPTLALPKARPAPQRVLVVDDIATNRLVAIALLRLAGAEGVEADSGTAALERLAAERFDAVLLDMEMPGLDGLATLARIRALDAHPARVPVIAMTADGGEAARARYLAAGCNGYLAKPITPDSIATALSSATLARAAVG